MPKKVLVVHSEKSLAMVINNHLKNIGFAVKTFTAFDSDLATSILEEEDLDLAIIGANTTPLKGLELAAEIKKAGVNVIITLASDDAEVRMGLDERKIEGVLLLPTERKKVKQIVWSVLTKSEWIII